MIELDDKDGVMVIYRNKEIEEVRRGKFENGNYMVSASENQKQYKPGVTNMYFYEGVTCRTDMTGYARKDPTLSSSVIIEHKFSESMRYEKKEKLLEEAPQGGSSASGRVPLSSWAGVNIGVKLVRTETSGFQETSGAQVSYKVYWTHSPVMYGTMDPKLREEFITEIFCGSMQGSINDKPVLS